MPKVMVVRLKLISVTSIFRFDIDVEKPDMSYMIHGLPYDLDLDEIKRHQNSSHCIIPSNMY